MLDLSKTQAERVYEKFGSAHALFLVLRQFFGREAPTKPTVYLWGYPRERNGCNGLIPAPHWPMILKAARHLGIIFAEWELYPVTIEMKKEYLSTLKKQKERNADRGLDENGVKTLDPIYSRNFIAYAYFDGEAMPEYRNPLKTPIKTH